MERFEAWIQNTDSRKYFNWCKIQQNNLIVTVKKLFFSQVVRSKFEKSSNVSFRAIYANNPKSLA